MLKKQKQVGYIQGAGSEQENGTGELELVLMGDSKWELVRRWDIQQSSNMWHVTGIQL